MTTVTDPNVLARINSVVSNGVSHKLKTKESLTALNEDIKAVAKDSGLTAKQLRKMIRIASSENPSEEGEDTDAAYDMLRQLKIVQ